MKKEVGRNSQIKRLKSNQIRKAVKRTEMRRKAAKKTKPRQ